jgi:hypothetical protein
MQRSQHFWFAALGVSSLVLLLYVGSYLVLIAPGQMMRNEGRGLWRRLPEYRFGADRAQPIFTPTIYTPIIALDAKVRPLRWTEQRREPLPLPEGAPLIL